MSDSTYQTKVYRTQGGDELMVTSGGKIVLESGGYFSAEGGDFYFGSGANMILGSGAAITIQSGAYLSGLNSALTDVYSDAAINIKSGATLSLGNSAIGNMYSNAQWAVLSNAVFQFNSGATLSLGNSAIINAKSDAAFTADSSFNFYFGSLSAIQAAYLGAVNLCQLNVLTVTNSNGAGSGVLSTVSIPARTGHVIIKASGACSNASMQLYSCLLGETLYICCQSDATLNSVSVAILASGGGANGVSLVGVMGSVLSRLRLDFSAQESCWVQLKAISNGCWAVLNTSPYVAEDANA